MLDGCGSSREGDAGMQVKTLMLGQLEEIEPETVNPDAALAQIAAAMFLNELAGPAFGWGAGGQRYFHRLFDAMR
jgi:hypothetical protein